MPKGIYQHKINLKAIEAMRMANLGTKHSEETKRKIGKANKISIKKLWQDEDYKKHMSEVHKGYKQSNKQKTKRNISLQKFFQSKQPTSIEKTLYDYLLLKGFLFEKQRLINGKFFVDAYIPSLNLVIEADGKYWHSLDGIVKKDKAENAYLTKCGFNLLRLSEKEIQNGKFVERLGILN